MSFLDKIGNILGKVGNFAGTIMKPIKNHVVQGASKFGNWFDRNHETIGAIASGVGTILQNLPSSKVKDKLEAYGEGLNNFGNTIQHNRPTNLARKAVSTFMNGRDEQQRQQEQLRPQPQNPATQPVALPIQQPAFTGINRNTGNNVGFARRPQQNARRVI